MLCNKQFPNPWPQDYEAWTLPQCYTKRNDLPIKKFCSRKIFFAATHRNLFCRLTPKQKKIDSEKNCVSGFGDPWTFEDESNFSKSRRFSVDARFRRHNNWSKKTFDKTKLIDQLAVVVAQLEEWPLLTPELHGLNPEMGKVVSTNCTLEKTKIKKKRRGMAHL